MKKYILLSFLFSFPLYAQMSVSVGEANQVLDKVLINYSGCKELKSLNAGVVEKSLASIASIVKNDFLFYKSSLDILYRETKGKISEDASSLKKYVKDGVQNIIIVGCDPAKPSKVALLEHFKVESSSVAMQARVDLKANNLREETHKATDIIFRSLTGNSSVFNSKVVFVSDEKSGLKNNVKELYMMDFDGFNVKKLTSHRGIILSPAFSPDNKKIIYSLIDSKKSKNKNVALYEINLATKTKRIISNKKGINSGAIYTADGNGIYLTLSHGKNADIYHMDLRTKALRKVTSHYAVDVDPSVNKNGSLMSFLSSRSGKAMIYTLDPRSTEKSVKRISYVGKFNATPRFSPDGSEIVFASWLDNVFDLFRLSASGHSLVRLTKNFGSNEDPSYSPDGNFIVFSSQRVISRVKADKNLYIMTRDGEVIGQLTKGIGQCSTPRFSN